MANFNDFQTKRLSELIEQHTKDKELEIRFTPPDEDTFKRVFAELLKDHAKSTATIEQSISIMTETDKSGTDRKELFFKDGVKQRTEHSRKHREGMLSVRSHTKQEVYRVALSSERPAPEFGMVSAFRIRIKLRCSIIIGDWRYDFTAALQLEKQQIPQLKQYKSQMFPAKKINPQTYLDSIPNIPGMRYEFEVEYIGTSAKLSLESIAGAVKTFSKYLSPGEDFEQQSDYQTAIAELAGKLINDKRILGLFKHKYGLKQLVNQPRNLTRAGFFNTIVPKISDYYLSDKADGERCLVRIDDHVDIILSDKIVEMPMFGKSNGKGITLCDAEIVNLDRDDPTKSKHPKLYLFDVLMHNGDNVTTKTFEEREKLMDGIAKSLKNVEKKIQKRLTKEDYGKIIREVYTRKTRAYPIDGLMFTPVKAFGDRAKYSKPADYFDMVVYKWKPPDQMTIDFLILKVPASMLGTKPYIPEKDKTLYILCSGISMHDSRVLNLPDLKGMREMTDGIPTNGNYFPIQFSHSAFPYSYLYNDKKEDLHQQIGEFIWRDGGDLSFESSYWELERMRPDKAILVKQGTAFGNNYKVAEEVFNNYLNPLSLDTMIDVQKPEHKAGQDYFLVQKSDIYKPLTKVNNYVKAQLIRQLEGKTWVVDLAAGKGQDLFTYNGFEVKNALFTDLDQAALEELGNRKWNLGNNNWYVFSRAPRTNINIYTMQHDLFNPAAEFLKKVENRGIPVPIGQVDGVVINLALHYLMKDEKSLNNIVNLVDKLLRPGGVFIFTTFDGERVFKLLEKFSKGGAWEFEQDGKVKYSIKKLYNDKKFTMGLPIGVIHPFSRGQHYEEPLADVDLIVKTFENTGFKIQQRGSFGDWHDKFKKFNPRFYGQLTSNDKTYDMLYTYVSLVKT